MNQGVDLVYPLGSGSRWQNNELRYSLRSVEKHLKGVRNIFIIGTKPIWLGNVIHIKADDPLKYNADGNIALKVLKACNDPRLSDTFLFINDDHIFLQDVDVLNIPYYHKGDLSKKSETYYDGGLYVQRLKRTRDILRKRKLPTLHFDCHTPILFDKKLFPEVMETFPFREGIGFTMKSLYANALHIEGLYRPDVNIKQMMNYPTICHLVEERTIMAFNDRGLNGDLKSFLNKKFPNPSKFEIMDTSKQVIFTEAENWLNAEDSTYSRSRYDEGVRIYCALGRNRHLMGLIRKERTERFLRAIERELKVIVEQLRKQGMKSVSQVVKKPQPAAEVPAPPVAQKASKSQKPKFNTNPYVDPNTLPEHLLAKFEENQTMTRDIGGLHAELRAVPKGEENNPARQELADKIVHMEKKRMDNWQEIDSWVKSKDTVLKITEPSGSHTMEEIERIEDEGVRALSKNLRIKANLRYIERYGNSEKEKQIEQVKLRKSELKAWKVNY